MYKNNSLWDQEQDKYDKTPVGEISGSYKDKSDYQNASEYNKKESSADYNKHEKHKEKKEEKSEFEKQVDDNLPHKKYEKKEDADEIVRKKAAQEIHKNMHNEKAKPNKKTVKSIEEAINNAIKEEKEVVRL
ncbi:MAG: hypothetical protein ABIC04_07420 [Nanoarchaeota archaeon]